MTGACGDGSVQSNEDCDDANIENSDGCAADCTQEWWDTAWKRRRKITFDTGQLTENLSSFPVPLFLNQERIDYKRTQSNGEDVRFVDQDGTTLLPHEIERWTAEGSSTVWVEAPELTNASPDYLWMYYDNPTALDGQQASSVWSNGFVAVWHLDKDGRDSTANGYSCTVEGATFADARIAGGAVFTGSEYLDCGQTGLHLTTVTASAWAYPTELGSKFRPVVTKGDTGEWGLKVERYGSWEWVVYESGQGWWAIRSAEKAVTDLWMHVAGTYGSAGSELVLNGVLEGTANSTMTTNTRAINIGRNSEKTDRFFIGRIDEVRLSSVVRPLAWLAAEKQSGEDAMAAYGPEEALRKPR